MARFAGKLHTWHEDRGFGFIRPSDGGQDVFVHVSALPKPRPSPDEVLTFEVGLNPDGKKKALDVRRQQVEAASLAADVERAARSGRKGAPHGGGSGKLLQRVIVMIIVAALGWYGYRHYQRALHQSRAPAVVPATAPAALTSRCDGRTMCSQMTSCDEATFFLRYCPGTQMDGNNDGVPCEKQCALPARR